MVDPQERGEFTMSDPVMDAYTQAYNSSGNMVQAFGVITEGGQVLWQSNNWDLTADAANLIAAVRSRAASVVQNQVKYSTMRTTPESLVAKSIGGNGILILTKVDAASDRWVVAWADPNAQPDGIYVDVDRAAKTLRGKI
ncbi:MAG: hypothetical protein DRO87_01455 [Candidatus Thorarchaeota archaeon]|nr:MAG: hypothetical protein DRP09_08270 [Candidatus Thorarchaeota archaeon]RLI59912.1 MAG: hypothetical protein DRO87_01455 [Candidatus Thorarchaeota archaeon]